MDQLDPLKKQDHEGQHVQAKQKQEFKFIGSSKRPHKGMKLWALDIQKQEVYEVNLQEQKLFDLSKKTERGQHKAYINPEHPMTWAINYKNAYRKFLKMRFRV